MVNSIQTLRKRDFKEREIDGGYEAERVNKESMTRSKNYTVQLLKEYQTWKKQNNVPGIKY